MNNRKRITAVCLSAIGPSVGLLLAISADAGGAGDPLAGRFLDRLFADDTGLVESASATVPTFSTATGSIVPVDAPLDFSNKFFDPAFGTNGQACASCHQPSMGFSISTNMILDAFDQSGGTDALFRANDTADNPHVSAPVADNYSLILSLGVMRIGKPFPANPNFTVVAADAQTNAKFAAPDVFPLTTDPQQPGKKTLSLFRRPLVNSNVRLDSAVMWDGRIGIGDMRGQVTGAAKALLLAPNPTPADADQVAAVMLGVLTDQGFDRTAGVDVNGQCTLGSGRCGAGSTSAMGATGGVGNLVSLAMSPAMSCTNFLQSSCAANVPGYDLFDAWVGSDDLRGANGVPGSPALDSVARERAARASVARGQEIFNTAVLHIPPDLQAQLGATGKCTTCHATRNIGNHPDNTFFARIGTDSVKIVSDLVNAGHPELAVLRDRVKALPQYCLRPTGDVGPGACGTHPSDVVTTDPGRAMVSGDIADVGKFKPPVLRGLTTRSPYFHNGAAENITALAQFYNARFAIGLTPAQIVDLTSFLEAQ